MVTGKWQRSINKTFQSNIAVINHLRDLVNVLNRNLSKLTLIFIELESSFAWIYHPTANTVKTYLCNNSAAEILC